MAEEKVRQETFKDKVENLQERIKESLVKQDENSFFKQGAEYGVIKGKNTMLKPGAEKVFLHLDIIPVFARDTDTWEMAGSVSGLFTYLCRGLDSDGAIRGEGRGAASLQEKTHWVANGNFNSPIKIAEKRAYVDAALRIGALSGMFTQDLEDTPIEDDEYQQQGKQQKPMNTAINDRSPICPKCGKRMKLRNSKRGQFWGCMGYPDCKQTFDYDKDTIVAGQVVDEKGNVTKAEEPSTNADSLEYIDQLIKESGI